MSDYITIQDRYTRTSWERKIGDGPWIPVDLVAWHGKAPIVWLKPERDVSVVETRMPIGEARLRGLIEQK